MDIWTLFPHIVFLAFLLGELSMDQNQATLDLLSYKILMDIKTISGVLLS